MKTLFLLLLTASAAIARYLPPAHTEQLLRRDTLPLDADRQRELAKDLMSLATRPTNMEGASEQRATAQLLALASALSPESPAPERMNRAFQTDTFDESFAKGNDEEALPKIAAVTLFLSTDKANPASQQMAELLLDPLAVIAPDLPLVAARSAFGEEERWAKSVAPLAFFQEKKVEKRAEEDAATTENPLMNEEEPSETPEEEVIAVAAIEPYAAALLVPGFTSVRNNSGRLLTKNGSYRFSLQAAPHKADNPILTFDPKTSSESLAATRSIVANLFQNGERKEKLKTVKGEFKLFGEKDYSSQNGLSLAFPMAVLLEGCLSQRQPVPGLTLLGQVAADGSLTTPSEPWKFLEILLADKAEETRRLIVPRDIYPHLEAFLTAQEEDFFFRYDVFCVANLEEAFEVAFLNSASPETEEALAAFEEIRAVSSGKTTSVFVANPHVATRLQRVKDKDPRLVSAGLLLSRGSSGQPIHHPSEVLASRIHYALSPLKKLSPMSSRDLQKTHLEKIHKTCRDRLDPLARFVALSDRELYDSARKLADLIRTIDRTNSRAKTAQSKGGNSGDYQASVNENFNKFKDDYYPLFTQIAFLMNETAPVDTREVEKKDE